MVLSALACVEAFLPNMRLWSVVGLLSGACALCILAAQHSPKRGMKTRLLPKYYSAATCTDKKHFANLTSYRIALDHYGGEYFTDGMWWLYRPMKIISKMIIILHRCAGGITANLCEYFATWKFDKALCALVHSKNVLWSPIVQSMEPDIKCPIASGLRTCMNGTLDLDIVEVIGARSGLDRIWQAEIQMYDELQELSICFNLTVELRRVRVKI